MVAGTLSWRQHLLVALRHADDTMAWHRGLNPEPPALKANTKPTVGLREITHLSKIRFVTVYTGDSILIPF